jgi:PIN domain nuclease of toxin-antitoxin system
VNYLLDTHSLLWAAFEPRRLGLLARQTLKNPESSVHVSSVSFWEISLKFALGKLELHNCSPESLPEAAGRMGFTLIPLDPETAASFHRLPRTPHRDPFDRMLIWQAIQQGLTLVSRDKDVADYAQYGLRTLW